MPDSGALGMFVVAALLLAVTPGPGIFYVLTRSIKGGRREGVQSSLGTGVGGLGHVLAAACGLSALVASSAVAFAVVKYAGAAYLVYLGCRTLLAGDGAGAPPDLSKPRDGALVQGVITELLNPKTALFFLALIPQFVSPNGSVFLQSMLLGSISVALNTAADLLVAHFAGPLSDRLRRSPQFRRRTRVASGGALIGLGAYAALADDPR
jgi:threonine/homoserine/homoserine lactone efflux protein